MSVLYNLFYKKKDVLLRKDAIFTSLVEFGCTESSINILDNVKPIFEINIDGYCCIVYLYKGKLVFIVFYELSDELFIEKRKIVESLFDSYTFAGRNYLEERIRFSDFTSAKSINDKAIELINVVKNENIPPMKLETVISLTK